MYQKVSRRDMLKSMALFATGALISACAPSGVTTTVVSATEETVQTPPTAKEVKVLFYAGPTAPTDPAVQLPEGEKPRVVLQKIVDAYRELHPNVTVEWYRYPEGVSMTEWLTARMMAQDAPDIYQSLPEDVFPFINKGYALDFGPAYDSPNPYLPDNKAWKEQFQDVAMYYAIGPDGKYYSAIMDSMGIMVAYNKTLFEKLGISEPPKLWPDFMNVCQTIKDSGTIPIAGDMSYEQWYPEWNSSPTLNQIWYDTIYKADDDLNKLIGSKEVAIHIQKGDWYDWDADLLATKLLKETVPYLPDGWQGKLELALLFRQQTCAMMYDGSWSLQSYKNDPPPFEIGWMEAPLVTKDISPKASGKVVATQGAWGQVNWHIPGYLPQTDPGKIDVLFDLLNFIFLPENVTALSEEGSMIPAIHGATAPPEMVPFQREIDRPVPYQGWENLSEDAYRAQLEVWGAYLPGTMSDKEYLDLANSTLNDQVRRVVEQNPDWEVSG